MGPNKAVSANLSRLAFTVASRETFSAWRFSSIRILHPAGASSRQNPEPIQDHLPVHLSDPVAGRHGQRHRRPQRRPYRFRGDRRHELLHLLVRSFSGCRAPVRRARSISPSWSIVRRLAVQAGMPMPKVYLIPSASPKAFAIGRNPQHATVAATEGIIRLLSAEEVDGVMAHKLAHVKNRDTSSPPQRRPSPALSPCSATCRRGQRSSAGAAMRRKGAADWSAATSATACSLWLAPYACCRWECRRCRWRKPGLPRGICSSPTRSPPAGCSNSSRPILRWMSASFDWRGRPSGA